MSVDRSINSFDMGLQFSSDNSTSSSDDNLVLDEEKISFEAEEDPHKQEKHGSTTRDSFFDCVEDVVVNDRLACDEASTLAVHGVNLEDETENHHTFKLEKPTPVRVQYDVSYSVDVKGLDETKVLLEGAAGEADAGVLMAIVGPSGAGKTTLMSVLACRQSKFNGTVLFNGESIMCKSTQNNYGLCCFVQQRDLFISSVTPREHLLFSARLRVDSTVSDYEKQRRVEALLCEFGLIKCAETPIGGIGSLMRARISGGERKRLSLATEILSNPFVDEPTSGLDSFMAEAVIAKWCRLALLGHTVVATIHQPSSYVFTAFSKLHLLCNGRTAY